MSKILLLICFLLQLTYINAANFICASNATVGVQFCPSGNCSWVEPKAWKCVKILGVGDPPTYPAIQQTDVWMNSTLVYNINPEIIGDNKLSIGTLNLGVYGFGNPPTVRVSGDINFYPTPLNISRGTLNLLLTSGFLFHDDHTSPQMIDKDSIFNWYSGTLTASDFPFRVNAGTMKIIKSPTGDIVRSDRTILIASGATMNIVDGATLVLGERAIVSVANGGTLSIIGNSTISTEIGGKLVCNGSLTINPGKANVATLDVNFLTNQTLNTQNGILTLGANATLSTVVNAASFTINLNGQSLSTANLTNNGFIYWNSGRISIQKGSAWTNNVGARVTLSGTTFTYAGNDVSTFRNYGTLVINNAITFRAIDVVNIGADSIMRVESAFTASSLTINGTQISSDTGSGSITQATGTFTWNSGTISIPVTLSNKVTSASLATTTEKIINNVVLTIQCPSTINGNVSLYQGPDQTVVPGIVNQGTMAANSASVYTGEAQIVGAVTNNGKIYGSLTLMNNVDLINNNQIGADYAPSNPITRINIIQGNLILTDSSKIYLDMYSGKESKITITGGTLNAAGSLVIRLRSDYVAYSNTVLNVLTYPAGGLNGTFSSITLDTQTGSWGNAGKCTTSSIVQDSAKNLIKVVFTGCGSAPSPNIEKHVSSNGTIVIVVVVVFVIAVIVGTVAWCKKKYRKRPWDRLRGDRL